MSDSVCKDLYSENLLIYQQLIFQTGHVTLFYFNMQLYFLIIRILYLTIATVSHNLTYISQYDFISHNCV